MNNKLEQIDDQHRNDENIKIDPIESDVKKEKATWKTIQIVPVDMEKLKKMDFKEKIFYLAMCGWKIENEMREGSLYMYAIRYIDRKKRRIYLGKSKF